MKMTTARWQIVSLISKLSAIIIGLLANIIVLRILSPEDWGIIGLALSIVGTVSVLHHLGIPAGLNREIAREKDPKNVPTIICSAIVMRFPVSVIIGTGVFIAAPFIANSIYQNEQLIFPLQLLGVFVVIDGVQDILSTSVGALKLFKGLFILQVLLSVINVCALVLGVYYAGFIGFIYAKFVYAGASAVLFGWLLVSYMNSQATFRVYREKVGSYIRNIAGIGGAAFIQKIAYLYWQKIPMVIMGKIVLIGDIGLYSFVDYFTQRLSIFADAATDVSVPVFMRSFSHDFQAFKKEFIENFWRVAGVTIVFLVLGSLYLQEFLLLTGLMKYTNAQGIFLIMSLAVLFASMLNTMGVVFVAGDKRRHMIFAYILMFLVTLILLVPSTYQWGVAGGAFALMSGSLVAFLYYAISLRKIFNISIWDQEYLYILLPLLLLPLFDTNLLIRVVSTGVVFTVYAYLLLHHNKQFVDKVILKFKARFNTV